MYSHKFCIAPMMNWTDRHCRYFYRLLSKHAKLYTEMLTTQAILNGNKQGLLDYHDKESPIALQLGGSVVSEMVQCAKIAQQWGYDEVNINLGCPSTRVHLGNFGVCLMKTPKLVCQCIEKMAHAVDIPITVKTRLGVDDMYSYEAFYNFINRLHSSGCTQFIVHARKAWLKGLNPKENRNIPPLNYDWVYKIKRDFPSLNIIINGGITDLDKAQQCLQKVDGVMLGRAIYHQPYLLADVDQKFYHQPALVNTREQVLSAYIDYIKVQHQKGVPIRSMTRHILGLYHGQKNARYFRRLLSEQCVTINHLYKWLSSFEARERQIEKYA